MGDRNAAHGHHRLRGRVFAAGGQADQRDTHRGGRDGCAPCRRTDRSPPRGHDLATPPQALCCGSSPGSSRGASCGTTAARHGAPRARCAHAAPLHALTRTLPVRWAISSREFSPWPRSPRCGRVGRRARRHCRPSPGQRRRHCAGRDANFLYGHHKRGGGPHCGRPAQCGAATDVGSCHLLGGSRDGLVVVRPRALRAPRPAALWGAGGLVSANQGARRATGGRRQRPFPLPDTAGAEVLPRHGHGVCEADSVRAIPFPAADTVGRGGRVLTRVSPQRCRLLHPRDTADDEPHRRRLSRRLERVRARRVHLHRPLFGQGVRAVRRPGQ